MSANQNTYLFEIINDLDLALERLRGACAAIDLIAEHSSIDNASDASAALFSTVAAARTNVVEAMALSENLHGHALAFGCAL